MELYAIVIGLIARWMQMFNESIILLIMSMLESRVVLIILQVAWRCVVFLFKVQSQSIIRSYTRLNLPSVFENMHL